MAIGVRILSDNLSGLTTNVTYLPESGGTIDLGVQTFPFNYISDYYWGTYNCYVPTYATTYSVVVPLSGRHQLQLLQLLKHQLQHQLQHQLLGIIVIVSMEDLMIKLKLRLKIVVERIIFGGLFTSYSGHHSIELLELTVTLVLIIHLILEQDLTMRL
jgi:hypothetical protein